MVKKILIALLLIAFAAMLAGFGYAYYYYNSIESTDISGFNYEPTGKSYIYSEDGVLLAEIYNENRTFVPLVDIPENLINAVIAVEDYRFYEHEGYDLKGIIRAGVENFKNQDDRPEGASTITQQLARYVFEDITTEISIDRKIKEIKTAIELEKKYTKNQILEMYMNEIYFGGGAYGVQETSRRFFGKDISNLTLGEAALIAGLPQAPSAYQPDLHFDKAKIRQEKVLDRMFEVGFITQQQAEDAKKEVLVLKNTSSSFQEGRIRKDYEGFVSKVLEEFRTIYIAKYGKEGDDPAELAKQAYRSLERDSLTIVTTINTKINEAAIEQVKKTYTRYRFLNQVTGALVTINSSTGRVIAYYGGETKIDMASTPRQPGSSIKPLIYSAAYQLGAIDEDTILNDEKTDFKGYVPENYSDTYHGQVSVRTALINSYNIPAVQVLNKLGVNTGVEYLKKFGVTSVNKWDYGLATALGGMTQGISPIEMATAYGSFHNDGNIIKPYFIQTINDDAEQIYIKDLSLIESTKAISSKTAAFMDDILLDVVNKGTGRNARISYPTAGKTGTTSKNKDIWFIGYTGKILTSIWIGNIDNKEIGGTGSYAAYTYSQYMKQLINNGYVARADLLR
ncbi:MAG: PBP1A family penicillin-binding protein [Eubacteriaceae bacterium]|nr:PBP1A family penicillin-binding protein [Eubacteriaceae bacterium]